LETKADYVIALAKDQFDVPYVEHGSSTITHVGIYIGNDQMINADTDPKDGVQIEYIFGDTYYNACYAGAKRFIF
jgi:peptidoglycan endopeptidase LytE